MTKIGNFYKYYKQIQNNISNIWRCKNINKICLKPLPKDNALPYLFYTNVKTTKHNNKFFENTSGKTFIFVI